MKTLRIGCLVDFVGAYGRDVWAGVAEYVTGQPVLQLVRPPTFFQFATGENWSWKAWNLDGLVAQYASTKQASMIRRARLAVVNVTTWSGMRGLSIHSDHVAIGRLAARHLLDKGFRHFAFVALDSITGGYAVCRGAAFVESILAAGRSCVVEKKFAAAPPADRAIDDLASWLGRTEKPVAVFAANDNVAAVVIETCVRLGIAVPEQVAVLGVDDDPMICRTIRPNLSSIQMPGKQVGFNAAAMLHAKLRGEGSDASEVVVPPVGLTVRQSTDTCAIEDKEIADVVQYIRQNAFGPLQVEDLFDAFALSRRSFERRFLKAIGRTLLGEIHRVRMEKAKELLIQTELAIPNVARTSGFGDACRFAVTFKRLAGTSPSEFRKRHRLRSHP